MIEWKTSKNVKFMVDEDIVDLLKLHSWCAINKRGIKYIAVGIWNKITKKTDIKYLHRLILKAKKGQYVDHINGNTLDNRRENLRICLNKENLRNRPRQKNNVSGFKGVHMAKNKTNPYSAKITVDGKSTHLGYFKTALEAAVAYNTAAIKCFGKFAYLNVIE